MLIETVEGTATDPTSSMTLINVVGDTAVPGNSYINEYSAMTVPGFWSGVRFICETLASFSREVRQELPKSKIVAATHPINTLLRRRMSDISSPFRTIETWIHHATVWGNGYLWVKRDDAGEPIALLNISPDIVAPFVYKGQKYFYLKLEPPVLLDDADVLHIAVTGFDGIRGYPLVQLMRFAIETPKLAEQFQKDFLRHGTFVNGSVETPQNLTDEQFKTLRNNLKPYSTPEGRKRFGYLVLANGAQLKNNTIPNQTSQMIESRKFSDIQICQILRISPHIIYQLDSQKLANVQQMGAEVVKYSLTPWATKIEEEFNLKLFTKADQDAGYFVTLNMDSLLRGDSAALSAMLLAELNGGVITVNEYRAETGRDPIGPQGDVLRVPVNFPNAGQPASRPGGTAPLEDDQAGNADLPPDPGDGTGPLDLPANGDGNPEPAPTSYAAALQPIIEAAINRIEAKATKAFANRKGKPADELVRWSNVFAAEQAGYVTEVFTPIVAAVKALNGSIDIPKLANRLRTRNQTPRYRRRAPLTHRPVRRGNEWTVNALFSTAK